MPVYRCPVCHKKLTKKEWEKAMGLVKGKEIQHQHDMAELAKKLREERAEKKLAYKKGIEKERAKTQRVLKGSEKKIHRLEERIKELQKGTTPQTEGLELEEVLTKRLQEEFPDDQVTHYGKAGDVLQVVMYQGRRAGSIIYECKRVPRFTRKHVDQAYQAKMSRGADFAVMVTTAIPKRGWNGFGEVGEVLVISPLGVLPLAGLLRMHLIEMLKAEIPAKKRAMIAQQVLHYVTSPEYKNPIEEIVRTSTGLQDELKREIKGHFISWARRAQSYNSIGWNAQGVHENVQLVLHGKKPKPIGKPKPPRLQLPAPPTVP